MEKFIESRDLTYKDKSGKISQTTKLMRNETSTLILLGDNARRTKEKDDQIQRIVEKSMVGNDEHQLVVIDTHSFPLINIRSSDGDSTVTAVDYPSGSIALKIIQKHIDKGNVTVVVYLHKIVKEWITLKESLPPHPVFTNVTTIHDLYET